jgi:hypothetical protein
MSIVKITLFQKNILTEISREQKQKLISQKSDFLVFPEFFPLTGKWSEKSPTENSKLYIDRLLEISEYYKGTIIGGTVIRRVDSKLLNSCPVIKDVAIIDWYDQYTKNGIFTVDSGDSGNVFMLDGVRFSILVGEDIHNESLLEAIHQEKIELVFNPSAMFLSKDEANHYTKDLNDFLELSKKYSIHIIRVSSIGTFLGKPLTGRSLSSCETGIKWKVAPFENTTEIIKTVSINIFSKV